MRVSLVPRLRSVTLALGMTAPVASVTVPRMSEVVSCACAAAAVRMQAKRMGHDALKDALKARLTRDRPSRSGVCGFRYPFFFVKICIVCGLS